MSRKNIMVVEDSGIVLLDIQKSLEALDYSVVATASTKEEAIRKAGETRPNLVLMDIRLGEEMAGIEAADHIREHFDIPVVFLTGYADEDTFQRAKITDPFGYILKPFDPKGLSTTIEIALHNHELKSRLRASEEKFFKVFQYAPVLITLDSIESGECLDANEKFLQVSGFSREEVIGRTSLELGWISKEDRARLVAELQAKGFVSQMELAARAKDGSLVHCLFNGEIIEIDGQRRLLAIAEDITQRKQTETALQESEQRLLEAQHLARLGNWEWNLADQTLTWSDEVYRIFGHLPGEIKASLEVFKAVIHPDDREDFLRQREKILAEGTPTTIGYRIVLPDGRVRHVQERSQLVRDDWGVICRMIGTVQDVTEQIKAEAALRESETLYHDLVETAQDLIWQCDAEGRYTYLNPAWEAVFGYKIDEMLGKSFSEFQSPEYISRDQKEFEFLLQGGSVKGFETVHLAKDGRELHLVFNAKTVYDQDGNVIGTRGTAYDITERKQNEAALQKSEYLLQESQKIAHSGHYDLDIPAGHWESSDSLNELFGIDWDYQTDVDGWLQIVYPADREMMAAYFAEEVLGKGQEFDKEYRIARISDGEMRWVHGLGKLEFDEDGNPIRMIGNIQDITARKHIEESLKESEENYRLVVESVDEGIISLDRMGNITEVNPAFLNTMGLERDELLGKNLLELFPLIKVNRKKVLSMMKQIIRDRKAGETELDVVNRRGESIIIRTRYSAIKKDGSVQGISAVVEDITHRKRAEEHRASLARIFDESLNEIYIFHAKMLNFILVNQAARNNLGYSMDEFRQLTPLDIMPEFTLETFLGMVKVLRGDKQQKLLFETVHLRKDGTLYDVEVHIQSTDFEGQSAFVAIILDITERKRIEEAIQESERRYRSIVEASPLGMHIYELQSPEKLVFVGANPAADTILGVDNSIFIGKTIEEAFPPLVDTEVPMRYKEAAEKGIPWRTEQIDYDSEGIRGAFEVNAFQIAPNKMVAMFQDITARRQAVEALRKSEERYRAVVENQTEFIVRWRPDGTRSFVNDAYQRYFHLTLDEALGTTFLPLIAAEDRNMVEEKFARLLSGRLHSETDVRRVIKPDGNLGWQEWTDYAIADEHGKVIEFQSVGRDITEKKQAELERQESERRFRETLETIKLIAVSLDRQGNITFCNDYLLELTGWERKELLGKSWFDHCLPPEVRTVVREMFTQTIETGSFPNHYENEIQTRSSERRLVVWNNTALRDIHGRVIGTTSIGEDVTERKQSEQALRDREAKLQSIFRAAPIGIGMVINRVIQEANYMLCQMTGYEREELIGQSARMLYPSQEDYEFVGTEKYRMIESNGIGTVETRWKRKDGNIRDILLSSVPLVPGDLSKGVTFAALDITNRKQAENSLRAKTAELEALFSISSHLRAAQSADEMLSLVLQEMRRVLHSDSNAVILLNPDGTRFAYAAGDGIFSAHIGQQFAIEKSISGLVQQTLQPYVTDDLSTDSNKAVVVQGLDELGPAVSVPVLSENNFLGVLVCARKKNMPVLLYEPSEIQLLAAIGEMVGNALRRVRLFDQALARLENVQALHSIDMAISANMDLSIVLDVLLTHGSAQLNADAASVLLFDPHTHTLEYAASYGFRTKAVKSARLRIGEGLPGQVALERKVLHIPDISKEDMPLHNKLLDEGFVSYLAAPLVAKGQLQGVLEIFTRTPMDVHEERSSFFETLATQAAIAIDNAQLFTNLQRSKFELEMAYDATIEGWSRALDLRDQETEGHTLRVTEMTLKLAHEMGVRDSDITHIRRGALLHDIGKMGVPDSILLKEGKLDPKEWESMKKHSEYAFEMLWPISFLRDSLDIPHFHHEKWDGTGYPRGLKGEEIPLSARIFAVADVWDALINNRPYRKAWPRNKALAYIRESAGSHFDPLVVEKFLKLIEKNGSTR